MRDQLSNRRVRLSQISSAPGAQTALVAELRRGFVRGRKPKDGLSGHACVATIRPSIYPPRDVAERLRGKEKAKTVPS